LEAHLLWAAEARGRPESTEKEWMPPESVLCSWMLSAWTVLQEWLTKEEFRSRTLIRQRIPLLWPSNSSNPGEAQSPRYRLKNRDKLDTDLEPFFPTFAVLMEMMIAN
jgi:hypothetical protein